MNKYKKFSKEAKKKRFIQKSCTQKYRYNTKEEADLNPYNQKSYFCKFCNGYHLTNIEDKIIRLIKSKGRAIINFK